MTEIKIKTDSCVKIIRRDKEITIFIGDGDWAKIPCLEFIADAETKVLFTHKGDESNDC